MSERAYQVFIVGHSEPEATYSRPDDAIAHAESVASIDQFTGTIEVVQLEMPNRVGAGATSVIYRVSA